MIERLLGFINRQLIIDRVKFEQSLARRNPVTDIEVHRLNSALDLRSDGNPLESKQSADYGNPPLNRTHFDGRHVDGYDDRRTLIAVRIHFGGFSVLPTTTCQADHDNCSGQEESLRKSS